jgi:hypothetical protein
MNLKEKLLDTVKKSTPNFDETKDSFLLEFEGGGDSFGSFVHFEVTVDGDNENVESDFNPEDHYDLIMEIMDKSGVYYTFQDYGSFCKMSYSDGEIFVESESPLGFDDSEFSETWEDEGYYDDEDEARDGYYDDMEIKFDDATLKD